MVYDDALQLKLITNNQAFEPAPRAVMYSYQNLLTYLADILL